MDVTPKGKDNNDEIFKATNEDRAFEDGSLNEPPETVQPAASSFSYGAETSRPWMLTDTDIDLADHNLSNQGTRCVYQINMDNENYLPIDDYGQ